MVLLIKSGPEDYIKSRFINYVKIPIALVVESTLKTWKKRI